MRRDICPGTVLKAVAAGEVVAAVIATIAANLAIFRATAPNRGRADAVAAAVVETATTAANPAISPGTAPNRDRVEVVVVDEEAAATCSATSAMVTVTCPASARIRIPFESVVPVHSSTKAAVFDRLQKANRSVRVSFNNFSMIFTTTVNFSMISTKR